MTVFPFSILYFWLAPAVAFAVYFLTGLAGALLFLEMVFALLFGVLALVASFFTYVFAIE